MISLNSAIKFHGHLGPWLVLGLIIGDYGLRKIKAKKYFGAKIDVLIPKRKPFSCLVDGLQLSSGCTLGKNNIRLIASKEIRVKLINKNDNKKITLGIKNNILKQLHQLKTHNGSIKFAKKIYVIKPSRILKVIQGA
jgi:formylmethanofuran dehydrogenase subunit E